MDTELDRLRRQLESEEWSELEEGLEDLRDLGLDGFESLRKFLDQRLPILAVHGNWRVRKAVAAVLSEFDRIAILTPLRRDEDARVSGVAEQSAEAWSDRRSHQAQSERRDNRRKQRLNHLKRTYGPKVAAEVHAIAMETLGVIAERVGHDLGGTVSTLLRIEQVLQDQMPKDTLSPEHWEYSVGSLPRVVRFLKSFTADFREYAAPARQERETIEVEKVLRGAATSARDSLESQGSGARIEVFASSSIRVRLPVGILSRCVTNLIKNALEATPNEGSIKVRGWSDSSGLYVRVEDDGPGMSEDVKALCFEPFRTTKREKSLKSCGLGLAIVRRKIEDHLGGTIQLDSVVGRGTTFVLEIPCMVEHE